MILMISLAIKCFKIKDDFFHLFDKPHFKHSANSISIMISNVNIYFNEELIFCLIISMSYGAWRAVQVTLCWSNSAF